MPDIARQAVPNSLGADGDIAPFVAFLIGRLPELAAEFASGGAPPSPPKSWIALMDDGEIISANDAAAIASVTAQAVRGWCAEANPPIGKCFAGVWLISKSALLNRIELDGLPARVRAEAIAKNRPKLCSAKANGLKK